MKKSVKISLLLISIFILAGLTILLTKKTSDQVLFVSSGCPHCRTVENFIKENKVTSYLDFIKLDVSISQQNSELFKAAADNCELEASKRGVPLFYDGENCYSGSKNIIDYFQAKNNK